MFLSDQKVLCLPAFKVQTDTGRIAFAAQVSLLFLSVPGPSTDTVKPTEAKGPQ